LKTEQIKTNVTQSEGEGTIQKLPTSKKRKKKKQVARGGRGNGGANGEKGGGNRKICPPLAPDQRGSSNQETERERLSRGPEEKDTCKYGAEKACGGQSKRKREVRAHGNFGGEKRDGIGWRAVFAGTAPWEPDAAAPEARAGKREALKLAGARRKHSLTHEIARSALGKKERKKSWGELKKRGR